MLISLIPGQTRGLENTIDNSIRPQMYNTSDIVSKADEETAEGIFSDSCYYLTCNYLEARRARIDSASNDDRVFEDEGKSL